MNTTWTVTQRPECYRDMVEAVGSNPTSPTIFKRLPKMQNIDDLNDALLRIEDTLVSEIDKANQLYTQWVTSGKISDYELEVEISIYYGDEPEPRINIFDYVKDVNLPTESTIERIGVGDQFDHHETFSRKTKKRMCWLTHCLLDGHYQGETFTDVDIAFISTIWYDLISRVQFEERFTQ